MFYTKLYVFFEYMGEALLAWALFNLHILAGTLYVVSRVTRVLLTPAAEAEIQTARMQQAVETAKALAKKYAPAQQPVTQNLVDEHDQHTLQ